MAALVNVKQERQDPEYDKSEALYLTNQNGADTSTPSSLSPANHVSQTIVSMPMQLQMPFANGMNMMPARPGFPPVLVVPQFPYMCFPPQPPISVSGQQALDLTKAAKETPTSSAVTAEIPRKVSPVSVPEPTILWQEDVPEIVTETDTTPIELSKQVLPEGTEGRVENNDTSPSNTVCKYMINIVT